MILLCTDIDEACLLPLWTALSFKVNDIVVVESSRRHYRGLLSEDEILVRYAFYNGGTNDLFDVGASIELCSQYMHLSASENTR